MTIISHRHKFIFLKSRKTAGSSVEGWLIPQLGMRDIVVTCTENHEAIRYPFSTPSLITRWPKAERRLKRRLFPFRPALHLDEHSTAKEVRERVGEQTWQGYFKFSIERSPWDRLLSLWAWRQHRLGVELSLDAFLSTIEDDPGHLVVENWSNLDIYAIDGALVVDETIKFDDLPGGLARIASRLGLTAPLDTMPRHKTGHGNAAASVSSLTQEQVVRIANLCQREIDLFGWPAPNAVNGA